MHENWLFITNVLAHWVAAMSGIVSLSLGIVEYFRKQKTEATILCIVANLFLLVAFDQAWQDEHRNSTVLISEKSSLSKDRDFWKSQNYVKDSHIQDLDNLNLQYLKAVTETQKTANSTQQSLTELTEKVFESTKPVPGRVITNSTRLNTVITDPARPFATTVILVGSVTKDYPSFKGSIECASPFELREGLLSQGMIGLTIPPSPGFAKDYQISFGGTTWRTGDTLYALIYGENLDPIYCHIKSQ